MRYVLFSVYNSCSSLLYRKINHCLIFLSILQIVNCLQKVFFPFFFFELQLTSITHAASCHFVINNCGVCEKRNTILLIFFFFFFISCFWINYVQIVVMIYIVIVLELLEYDDSSKLWLILKFREILFWNNANFARSVATSDRSAVTILLPANCCLF